MSNTVKSYKNGQLVTTPTTSVAGVIAQSYVEGQQVATPVAGESVINGEINHNDTLNRNNPTAHQIPDIENLQNALENKLDKVATGENIKIRPDGMTIADGFSIIAGGSRGIVNIVSTFSELPMTGNYNKDEGFVIDEGKFYVWIEADNTWYLEPTAGSNSSSGGFLVGQLVKNVSPLLETTYQELLINNGRRIYEDEYPELFNALQGNIYSEVVTFKNNTFNALSGLDENYRVQVEMTDYTAPTPLVASSTHGSYAGYPVWKMFNTVLGENDRYSAADIPGDGILDFGAVQPLTGVSYHWYLPAYPGVFNTKLEVYGSLDKINWEKISEYTTATNTDMYHDVLFGKVENYRYYKTVIVSTAGGGFNINASKWYYDPNIITRNYKILPAIAIDSNGYYSYTCAKKFSIGGGTGSNVTVNDIEPDINGNIPLYAYQIPINETNSTDIQTELETLRGEKLDQSEFLIKNALDMANVNEEDFGLMARLNGNFQIGGLVKENNVVPEIIELQLSNNLVYTNQVVNNILPFDVVYLQGQKFSKDGYGVLFNSPPIDVNGYTRVSINITGTNQLYPITIEVGAVIDGIQTDNFESYTFTGDGNQLFSVNSKNDAVQVNAGQKVEIFVRTNKALTAKDMLTVFNHSFIRVSDRGVNDEGIKIRKSFVQSSRIALKNSANNVPVPSTPTRLNFTAEASPTIGTAFEWSILRPYEVKVKRKCEVDIIHTEYVAHSTNSTGVLELRVYINGVFQQNYYRRRVVNLNAVPVTVEFIGIGVDLNEGDLIEIYTNDGSASGNITRITDTNHVGSLLIMKEV